MEQRSVIRSESFFHNILPQLIFPLERQVFVYLLDVVRKTPMLMREELEHWKILLLLQPHRRW